MDDLLNNWCQYWFWSSSQLWSAGCTCLALNKSRCSLSTSSLSWERDHSLWSLTPLFDDFSADLTFEWFSNLLSIRWPAQTVEGFRKTLPSICFRKHESQWSKSDNLHRQRIIPRQPLTFEVEIIDASQGLDSSSWHCRTMGVSKSYGASFWCPSDIILICTKKWLLCMTSLPYKLVCSQNQLLSQIDCSLEKVSSVKLDITNSRNIL